MHMYWQGRTKTTSKAVDQYYSLPLDIVQDDISFHFSLSHSLCVRSFVRAVSSLSIDSDLTFFLSFDVCQCKGRDTTMNEISHLCSMFRKAFSIDLPTTGRERATARRVTYILAPNGACQTHSPVTRLAYMTSLDFGSIIWTHSSLTAGGKRERKKSNEATDILPILFCLYRSKILINHFTFRPCRFFFSRVVVVKICLAEEYLDQNWGC